MKIKTIMVASLLSLGCFISCSNDDNIDFLQNQPKLSIKGESLNSEEAQVKFALILSKAVYESESLRAFLKDRAIEQFDNDYDVFYPLVRDMEVENERTFREILCSFSENNEDLENIERVLPLLNILIPDLSLFCNVKAENMDVTSNILPVAIANNKEKTVLYLDGDSIGVLEPTEVPAQHILVIKNNERVVAKEGVQLRSSSSFIGGYEFIDDAFDKSKNFNIQNSSITLRLSDDRFPQTDYLLSSHIEPKLRAAWTEFNSSPYQRDYIYYGLTKNKLEGKLDHTIEECLYRFQIDPNIYYRIADQNEDPKATESKFNYRKRPASEDIIKSLWTEGNFEIVFDIFTGAKGSKDLTILDKQRLVYSIKPYDLFECSYTWINDNKSMAMELLTGMRKIKLDPSKNLKRKWYYPAQYGYPTRIDKWNLESQSLERYFSIFEHDEQEKITEKVEQSTTYTQNFKVSGEGAFGKFKVGLGYDVSSADSKKSSTEVVKDKGDDDLGTLKLYFYDSVITNVDGDKYYLKNISNSSVTISMLPVSEQSGIYF